MEFDKIKALQSELKNLHNELNKVKNSKDIEKYNKLNELQKNILWVENSSIDELFSSKGNNDINHAINRLQGAINVLKFLIKAEQTMKEIIQLKEALKAEIRNILNEDLQELARVATTIKISNLKAAQAYADANKGKWVSDMVQAVIDAGDSGITQPDLAAAIGKGSQQSINPKVRELLAAGVFSTGEASVKTEPKSKEDKPNNKPQIKALPPKSDEDNEDIDVLDDEDEIADEYFKSDEDDSSEDEDELAKKATPNKGVQSKANQLDSVIKQMKALAAKYKSAEGQEKADITAQLKDLTKQKSALEKDVKKTLGDEDDDIEDLEND